MSPRRTLATRLGTAGLAAAGLLAAALSLASGCASRSVPDVPSGGPDADATAEGAAR